MVIGLIGCLAAELQVCPYVDAEKLLAKCAGNAEGIRSVKATIATTVFDVLSDVLIVSIPICLLWRVRISMRQKFGLGITLCLSLVMVIIAFVRIGGNHLPGGQVDVVWLAFWQQNECNIAVWMVSMTAFRSFFTSNTQEDRSGVFTRFWVLIAGLKQQLSKLFPKLFRSSRNTSTALYPTERSDRSAQLMIETQEPNIPRATITGARTAIEGAGRADIESMGVGSHAIS